MRRISMAIGAFFGIGMTLVFAVMLSSVPPPKAPQLEQEAQHFEVVERRAPPKPKLKQPKPKPKKNTAPPPPSHLLNASLSGLSFGIDGLDNIMAQGANSLLESTDALVMTSDTVDVPPRPVHRVSADYPARARSKGLEGYVTMSILIDDDGSVQDILVVEASPPNVFDTVATAAVRDWRFVPGEYKGDPVSVRVTQTLRFVLGS